MSRATSFSVKETAALAGLSERKVRNEIARGVIGAFRARRGRARSITLPSGAVVYFRLMRDLRIRLPRRERSDLYRVLAGTGKAGHWRDEGGVLRAGVLLLDVAKTRVDLDSALRAYEAGRRRIVTDPNILGGEPVFAGTRISVRHIGGLVRRGIPASDIASDYPALGEMDLAFAEIFVRMKPAPGRPRKLKFRRETG